MNNRYRQNEDQFTLFMRIKKQEQKKFLPMIVDHINFEVSCKKKNRFAGNNTKIEFENDELFSNI